MECFDVSGMDRSKIIDLIYLFNNPAILLTPAKKKFISIVIKSN